MPSLGDMMKKRYGMSDEGSAEEEASESEGDAAEEAKLGNKLSSAIKGGDGETIYNAFAALHAQCNMKS